MSQSKAVVDSHNGVPVEFMPSTYLINKGLVIFLAILPLIESQLTISLTSSSERHHRRVNSKKSKQERAPYRITSM